MSGEVVATPIGGAIALVAWLPITGVAIAGSRAAYAIQAIVDKQVKTARRQSEEECRQIIEWNAFQVTHRQRLDEVFALQEAFRQAGVRLSGVGPGAVMQPSAWEHNAPSYAGASQGLNQADELLRHEVQNVGELLREFPESFRLNPQSPFMRMKQWYENLEASFWAQPRLLRPEAVISFKNTLINTFEAYIAKKEAESRRQEEMIGQLNGLLNEIHLFRQLASSEKNSTDINYLWHDLQKLLSNQDIASGHFQHIVKRFDVIRQRVALETAGRAGRQAIREALVRNFTAIGYQFIYTSSDPDGNGFTEAILVMPRGVKVRVRIATDGSLGFHLMHNEIQPGNTISNESIEFYKQQEIKWCSDLKDVTRNMAIEGFVYDVKFEQNLYQEKIPVVVLETGDELVHWREEENKEEEDEMERFNREDWRRYLS